MVLPCWIAQLPMPMSLSPVLPVYIALVSLHQRKGTKITLPRNPNLFLVLPACPFDKTRTLEWIRSAGCSCFCVCVRHAQAPFFSTVLLRCLSVWSGKTEETNIYTLKFRPCVDGWVHHPSQLGPFSLSSLVFLCCAGPPCSNINEKK